MSRIDEIRESIDTKLNKWEAEVAALDAHLNLSKDQAIEKLETQKKQFAEVLTRFKAKVDESKTTAKEEKKEIRNKLEHLQAQLALGKAKTKAAYESQKKEIKDAIKSFEASIDREFDDSLYPVVVILIDEANALTAYLGSMEVQFEREKAKRLAQFKLKKNEIAANVLAFRKAFSNLFQ